MDTQERETRAEETTAVKKLRDVLAEIAPDEQISVGVNSGWFFFGTKDELIAYEDGVNEMLTDWCRNRILAATRSIVGRCKSIMECVLEERRIPTGSDPRTYFSILVEAYRHYDEALTMRDSFVPVMDRTVKEKYEKPVSHETAIVLDGFESRGYWVREEYDQGHGAETIREYQNLARGQLKRSSTF